MKHNCISFYLFTCAQEITPATSGFTCARAADYMGAVPPDPGLKEADRGTGGRGLTAAIIKDSFSDGAPESCLDCV